MGRLTSGEDERPHVLMMPIAGSGHFYPFLQLLYYSARYDGVTVTVVSNGDKLSELSSLRSRGEFQGLDLRLEHVFGTIPWYPSDPYFPVRAAMIADKLAKDFQPFARHLIQAKGSPGMPTCVVSDMYLSSPALNLANDLDIPWYPLYVGGPAIGIATLEAPKLYSEGLHPHYSPSRNIPVNIPGLEFARVRDVPHQILEFNDFYKVLSESLSRASTILFNTAEELDTGAGGLDAIRVGMQLRASAKHCQVPKVLAIGPILNFPGFAGPHSSTTENTSSSLKFLNTQAPSSVIYISFGSTANISPGSMTELAHGLEASGVPFLWALKLKGSLSSAVLPPGFEERIRGYGFIETGWAPQAQILLHPSTGGFLSHCGWNSVLESFCSGVPVITWPISADQPLNARYIENVVKSGVSVKSFIPGDERVLLPSREDVQRAVTLVMVEEKGRELRKNAQEMKKVVREAVAEGGSSHQALHSFLDEILLRSQINAEVSNQG